MLFDNFQEYYSIRYPIKYNYKTRLQRFKRLVPYLLQMIIYLWTYSLLYVYKLLIY